MGRRRENADSGLMFQVDIAEAVGWRLAGERGLDVQENRSIFVPGVAWLWLSVRRWAPPTLVFATAALSCKHAPLCLASAMLTLGHSLPSPFPPSSTDAAPACGVPHADAGGGRVHHCKGVGGVDSVGDMDNVGIVMGEYLPACPSLKLLREEGLELPASYLLCCIDDPPPSPPSPILLFIPQCAQLSSAISAMFPQAPARIVQVRHPRQWLVEGVGEGGGRGRYRMLSAPFQATRTALFAEGRTGPAHSLLCFLPFPSTSFSYSLTL